MKTKIFISVILVLVMFVAGAEVVKAQNAKEPTTAKRETAQASEEPEVQKIDVNSATQEELETLPGIGEKCAQAIIEGRPYENVEDLLRAKGIGEKKLAAIRDLIEVKPIEEQSEQKSSEETQKEEKKGE